MSVRELRHDRPSGPSGWFSKSRGLSASVSFLSSPTPPCSFTCATFRAVSDSCSSFFAPKPPRNACYVSGCRWGSYFPPSRDWLGNLRWRRFQGDGDRTRRASLEQRQPSLPSKIRTLRSKWTQEDGALEDYRRGKYGFIYRIKRINAYLLACNNNNNFISVFPRYYVVLPTILNNFQYVSFMRYSNKKSELKMHN